LSPFIEIAAGPPRILCLTHDFPVDEASLASGLSDESHRQLRQITHPARRQEFLRARYLVRKASAQDVDPPRDGDGVIRWPEGLVGSVSHSLGDVIVATAPRDVFRSVGIDLERPSRIRAELAEKICTPRDLELVASGSISVAEVFAAKEALFKCHFPLGRKRFWFLDAELAHVARNDTGAELSLRVLVDSGPMTPAGTVSNARVIPVPLDDAVLVWVAVAGPDRQST